ncbi:MAG: tetratricopeptide repeat protein [Bacteroidia bacterium]|nr:tetratricopeptide repeat protein [Bacteroidia bacterium]
MRLNNKYLVCGASLLLATCAGYAQEDAHTLYDGNKLYHSGKIPESSAKYAKALELNPNNRKANFNLGNSLYKNAMLIKSGNLTVPSNPGVTPDSLSKMIFDQAAQNFAIVANSVSDKDTLHRAWHNIGNCYLQKKEYKQAADAYKKSLKFDPKDEETRYNLAYALKHLPKEKKGGGGQSQQQQQQQKQEKKDQQQQQQQQSQMSKEQAEQLLKAMMNSEKKLQEKRKQKTDNMNNRQEKDW